MKRAFLLLLVIIGYFGMAAQTGSLTERLSYVENCLYDGNFEEGKKVLLEIEKPCQDSESDSIKAVFCFLTGSVLINEGDYEKGIQFLQVCCALREKEEDIFMNEYWDAAVGIIDTYVDMEDYKNAAYYCRRFLVRNEESLELNPTSLLGLLGQLYMPSQIPWIYSQLGNCMEALGDNDIVDGIYWRGQQYADKYCDPKDPWGVINLYNLRRFYSDNGLYGLAHDPYLKISEKMAEAYGYRHPEYVKSIGNLISFYRRLFLYDKAVDTSVYILELAEDSIGLCDPSLNYVYPHYLISLSYLGRYDDIETALPYAKTAISLDKESVVSVADLYYHIAYAANSREDRESAQKYYNLYLSELEDKSTAKPLEQ
jgi:hypothetical protein